MMKCLHRILLLFSLIFFDNNIFAQNLLFNGSFEYNYSCPTLLSEIDTAIGWTSFSVSPDYFESCGSFTICNVPMNLFGYQLPYDGQSYAGFIAYINYYLPNSNAREYIGTHLPQPLSVGKKYYVSAYFSRADFFPANGASNNLGFRFFTNQFSQLNPFIPDNYAQVYDSAMLRDSVNWTKISGSFIADSAYNYLAIGNFFDDLHTDTTDMPDTITNAIIMAYYYVDFVCLTDDSTADCSINTADVNNVSANKNIESYPNPFENYLNINSQALKTKFIIYNFLGEAITVVKFDFSTLLNTGEFESGIYFYKYFINSDYQGSGELIKVNR